MGVTVVRMVVAILGVLSILAGVALVALAGPGTFLGGLVFFGLGAAMLVGVAIERMRYRSAAAELTGAPPGPGGGEPTGSPTEARFRRTDEVFIDPTTQLRMRVLADPRTGERRYVAES
jgi:hypothetical protein